MRKWRKRREGEKYTNCKRKYKEMYERKRKEERERMTVEIGEVKKYGKGKRGRRERMREGGRERGRGMGNNKKGKKEKRRDKRGNKDRRVESIL